MLKLSARTARLRSGTLNELGLTHARLRVLGVVAKSAELSMSQIARYLDLSRQAVHRVIHDLVKANVLTLSRPQRNRKIRIAELTTHGRAVAELALPWENDWTGEVLANAAAATLRGIAAQVNYIREKLPWTVRGPDESALYFETS